MAHLPLLQYYFEANRGHRMISSATISAHMCKRLQLFCQFRIKAAWWSLVMRCFGLRACGLRTHENPKMGNVIFFLPDPHANLGTYSSERTKCHTIHTREKRPKDVGVIEVIGKRAPIHVQEFYHLDRLDRRQYSRNQHGLA